jgi:hypothetical protein
MKKTTQVLPTHVLSYISDTVLRIAAHKTSYGFTDHCIGQSLGSRYTKTLLIRPETAGPLQSKKLDLTSDGSNHFGLS